MRSHIETNLITNIQTYNTNMSTNNKTRQVWRPKNTKSKNTKPAMCSCAACAAAQTHEEVAIKPRKQKIQHKKKLWILVEYDDSFEMKMKVYGTYQNKQQAKRAKKIKNAMEQETADNGDFPCFVKMLEIEI